MPFTIRKKTENGKTRFCVVKKSDPEGKSYGCSDTEEEAIAQIGAIESNEKKELSVEETVGKLVRGFYGQFHPNGIDEGPSDSVIGCYKNYIVVAQGEQFFKVPFKGDMASPAFTAKEGWIEVEPAWDKKKELSSFKVFDDGTWVGIFTNAFEDREEEFFATVALKEFVEWTKAEDIVLPLWFWHIPYDMGTAEAFEIADRMVVAGGHLNETGKAIAKWYSEHPEEKLGMSHKFDWNPLRKEQGTYYWFRPREITYLPLGKAANPFTDWVGGTMSAEKKDKLAEILGSEKAAEILAAAADKSKELAESGVAFKEVEAPKVEPVVAETPKVEPVEEKKEGEPVAARFVMDEPTLNAIAAAVAAQLIPSLEKLGAAMQPLATAVENQGKELMKEMAELKKADETKVKEMMNKLPKLEIYRPTVNATIPERAKEGLAPAKSILDMTFAESIEENRRTRS